MTRERHGLLWCQGPLYISFSEPSHLHCPKQTSTGSPTLPQDLHVNPTNNHLGVVLLLKYLLPLPEYFKWVHVSAMSSPISPLIDNLFMEEFKVKPSVPPPITLVMAQVCEWHLCHPRGHIHSPQFLQHINSLDLHIQFTMENPKEDGSIPVMDSLVSLGPNNTLTTSVYRKPTHTDQYLHWSSYHNVPAKHSVYNTLAHRARVVCTSQSTLKQEKDHIRQALLRWSYPSWALNRLYTKINHRFNTNWNQRADNTTTTTNAKPKTSF